MSYDPYPEPALSPEEETLDERHRTMHQDMAQDHRRFPWGVVITVCILLYPGVAWGVFQFRHPTANSSVFWTHLPTVLSFGTVEEFRPKPQHR